MLNAVVRFFSSILQILYVKLGYLSVFQTHSESLGLRDNEVISNISESFLDLEITRVDKIYNLSNLPYLPLKLGHYLLAIIVLRFDQVPFTTC